MNLDFGLSTGLSTNGFKALVLEDGYRGAPAGFFGGHYNGNARLAFGDGEKLEYDLRPAIDRTVKSIQTGLS